VGYEAEEDWLPRVVRNASLLFPHLPLDRSARNSLLEFSMRICLAAALVLLPSSVWAGESVNCVGQSLAYLGNVTEPLSQTTRSYAQGAVRILILSAAEPACCGSAVAVLLPDPLDGTRICRLLFPAGGQGWGGLEFGPGPATYDATSGLSVPMTASVWDGEEFRPEPLTVVVDQGAGRVHAH